MSVSELFYPEDSSHIKKQREQARWLRKTDWWKRKLKTGLCHHCGKKFPPEELTMDHLVPLVRGGKTGKNNVVPACKPCNSKKNHQTLVEFKLKNT